MTARPASFEPLASSDPVPGNPYEVAALGKRLSDTAAEIETQVANLRKLAEHSTDFWTGKAASKFHDSASDLAGRIEKAHRRYDTTGSVLTGWSRSIDEAQGDAYPAVLDAQAAEQSLQANAPQPAPPAGSPAPTADEVAATKRRAGDHADAQTKLDNARSRFEAAVSSYNSKAKQAADAIGDAASHDGLKDSWWDRNFHWIAAVMKIVAIVIIVLAVIAIVIACPFSAGLFAALAISAETVATISTVVEIATAVLVGASLIFDSAAAATGKQSWTAAILDVVSLATMGFGRVAMAGIGGLAEYGEGVAKSVTAARAGRAAMADAGYPEALWSIASRSSTARSLLGIFPKLGGALDGAELAAADATRGLTEAVEGVKGSNLVAMLTQKGEIAESFAKVNMLADRFPTVLRLAGTKIVSSGIVGVDAVVQTATFGTVAGFTGHTLLSERADEKALEGRLEAIVERFSHPLISVP